MAHQGFGGFVAKLAEALRSEVAIRPDPGAVAQF